MPFSYPKLKPSPRTNEIDLYRESFPLLSASLIDVRKIYNRRSKERERERGKKCVMELGEIRTEEGDDDERVGEGGVKHMPMCVIGRRGKKVGKKLID